MVQRQYEMSDDACLQAAGSAGILRRLALLSIAIPTQASTTRPGSPILRHSAIGVASVISKADVFILLGVAIAFVLGVYLFFNGEREQGIFAATWVPAILAFGIYFKLMRRKR